VLRLGESVRKSVRQLRTILLGVLLTKIAIGLIGVHNQPLVELAMGDFNSLYSALARAEGQHRAM
jgi:hypothetical protein